MNTTTILDLITAREAAATAACEELREQMTKLAGELTTILAPTRQTLIKIAQREVTSPDPAIISEPCQRIIAVFTPDGPGLRAKDICLALGVGTGPKGTEDIRATLKHLVNRQILADRTRPVTLTPKRS